MKTLPDSDQPQGEPKTRSQGTDAQPGVGQPSTHQLGDAEHEAWVRGQQQMLQELRKEASSGRPPLQEGTIALHVLGMAEPLIVKLETDITLGRFDAAREDKKCFDLTPYNAYALGVSRRHVILRRQGSALTLTDLESTNGTLLNGKEVISGQPYLLHDGDELILGELLVRVYF